MSNNNNIDTSILKEVFLTPSQEIRTTSTNHALCGGGNSATNETAPCSGSCRVGSCEGGLV